MTGHLPRGFAAAFIGLTLAALAGTAHAIAPEGCRFGAWPANLDPGSTCVGTTLSIQFTYQSTGGSPLAATAPYSANVFVLSNRNAVVQSGEPNEGGTMQKTQWGKLYVSSPRRIVVHTFGSGFDTLMAVYRGTAFNNLVRITGNDDRAVPGFGTEHSLVQFNAVANQPYNIQIGSKGAEGDIVGAVFNFPPTGGLSAFLATVGTTKWNGRDYLCVDAHTTACGSPLFILHNSTNKTLTVTGSSNLGAGVAAPAAFTLAPNQIKTARFIFGPGFNRTTPRTVSGFFTFVGKEGATEIAQFQQRALITVGNPTLGNVLRSSVTPAIRAGAINEFKPFDVTLTNSASATAIGCHARHDFSFSARLKVKWQRFNPANGALIGAVNQLFNLAAGQKASVRVFVASQQTQLADPEFPTRITIDCANTAPMPINLFNTFDLTALGLYRPAQVDAIKLAPLSDTLDVPAAGTATIRFSVANRGAAAFLRVVALYIRPFADWSNPNKQFSVTMCRLTSANGACQGAPSQDSIGYTAAANSTAYFKFFVTAPSVNPGYAPSARRVFLKVWGESPPEALSFDAPVAAESVAVRKL